MDAHYIDVTLFWKKRRLHNQIFFRNQVGQGAPTDYSIYYTTKSYTIVQTFSTNLLHKYNKLFEFYNSTNTKTFCDKQPYKYSLLPKSGPVACCKFHPLDNKVTTVSIQIKWNKLRQQPACMDQRNWDYTLYFFLLENNVLKGFMYVRLYSYNNNHLICIITSHSIFHAKYAHVWPWGVEPTTSGLTRNCPNHSAPKSLVTKGHKYSPHIHFTRYDYLRPKWFK